MLQPSKATDVRGRRLGQALRALGRGEGLAFLGHDRDTRGELAGRIRPGAAKFLGHGLALDPRGELGVGYESREDPECREVLWPARGIVQEAPQHGGPLTGRHLVRVPRQPGSEHVEVGDRHLGAVRESRHDQRGMPVLHRFHRLGGGAGEPGCLVPQRRGAAGTRPDEQSGGRPRDDVAEVRGGGVEHEVTTGTPSR